MNIENRKLYDLFRAVKTDGMGAFGYGLYIQGEPGRVTAYACNNYALYKQVFSGDNTETFMSYFSEWKEKSGSVDTRTIEGMSEKHYQDHSDKFEGWFSAKKTSEFTVKAVDLKKAINAVNIVYKGEKPGRKNIVLSANGGSIDVAAWNDNEEHAVYSIDGVDASGAAMVDSKYLGNMKGNGELRIAFCENHLHMSGELEMIMPLQEIDAVRFAEVLEYEYRKSEAVEINAEMVPKAAKKPIKPTKRPRKTGRRKAKKDFTGWTWNPKKSMWTKVCNW